MPTPDIQIIGAGPAGLAAAIHLARAGARTVVFEQTSRVAARFQGEFHGLESWSTDDDACDFVRGLGLAVNFTCVPHTGGTFFGPAGHPYEMEASAPLFYLIERGDGPGALDRGLLEQALEAGAEVRFSERVEHVTAETVVVATGPHAPDAIARGVLFETSHPDACYGFIDDHLAPRGYAYLLVHDGRATLATCLFDDFAQAHRYFDRTLAAVLATVGLDVRSPRAFGGYVNFGIASPWTRHGRRYLVGERAGFQDALWGFGLRYALFSGTLAAQAIVQGADYDALVRRHLLPRLEVALANRLLYSQLGNHGYEWVLQRLAGADVLAGLRAQHRPSRGKRLLYELAQKRIHPALRERACHDEGCACLWCTHGREMDVRAFERCVRTRLACHSSFASDG